MIRKAKLDVLENLPDIDLTDATIPIEEHQELPLSVTSGKWAFNKLIMISLPAVIVVLVITCVMWFYLARPDDTITKRSGTRTGTSIAMSEKKSRATETASATAAIEPAKVNSVCFKDFIIDLKDKTGKSKILMCDFVFDIGEEENIAGLENREDIRSLIYQTTKGRSAIALRSIEERKKLKKELLQELNKMLGDGFIKNIYVTNYVIM